MSTLQIPDLDKISDEEAKEIKIWMPKLKGDKDTWLNNCADMINEFLSTQDDTKHTVYVNNMRYNPFEIDFIHEEDIQYLNEIVEVLSQKRGTFIIRNDEIRR